MVVVVVVVVVIVIVVENVEIVVVVEVVAVKSAERQSNGACSSGEPMKRCKARMCRQLVKQTCLQ